MNDRTGEQGMNPFDDLGGSFYALENADGQFSLWPTFAAVPTGWHVAYGKDSRERCVAYIEKNWTDMRPRSVIEAEVRAICDPGHRVGGSSYGNE
jgi:MbtH protein